MQLRIRLAQSLHEKGVKWKETLRASSEKGNNRLGV